MSLRSLSVSAHVPVALLTRGDLAAVRPSSSKTTTIKSAHVPQPRRLSAVSLLTDGRIFGLGSVELFGNSIGVIRLR
jgi:hypothetical protein